MHVKYQHIRRWSDKYLTSPPEGATIAREIYYRVVHSRRRLHQKFQSNRTRSFVLTACGNERVRGFYKNGKRAKEQYRWVIRFLFFEGISRSEIKERLDAVYGDSSPSMATVKNWFHEFQRESYRFLISHVQVS